MNIQSPRTIWDGSEFRQVSKEEADKLVRQDKAQDLTDLPVVASDSLKFRHEFTGYSASKAKSPPPSPTPAPAAPLPTPTTPPAAQTTKAAVRDDTPMKDWRTYRKLAAEAVGKPLNRVTKADVEFYLASQKSSDTKAPITK